MNTIQTENIETNAEIDKEYLTVTIGDNTLGIPVLQIQDVLQEQSVTHIPLAQYEIAGSLNLRGRVVTAIDMRKRLGLENASNKSKNMNVVVEHGNELYSLIVDDIGDVLSLSSETFEKNPATMEESWSSISSGIFRLEEELLIVIDVDGLLRSFDRMEE